MKDLSPELIAEIAKGSVTAYRLLKIGSYILYTDRPEGISYNGDTYTYNAFTLPEIKMSDSSPLDGGDIILSTVDLTIPSLILNGTIKNTEVFIYEQYYDESDVLKGTKIQFTGKVDGRPAFNELEATVTVIAHLNPLTQRFPRTLINRTNFPMIPKKGTQFIFNDTVYTIK